jgi:fatty-acyl-CoA synthase
MPAVPARLTGALSSARVLAGSGLLDPVRPDRLVGMGIALARWGITPATGYAAGAARTPHRPAVIDELGVLSWRDVDRRSDRIAGGLRAAGVQPGRAVGCWPATGAASW